MDTYLIGVFAVGVTAGVLAMVLGLVWLGTDFYQSYLKPETPQEPPVQTWKLTRETIQLTNDLELFIDRLIEYETFAELFPAKTLNEQYDIRQIDKGIESIANKVFGYLNPDVFYTRYAIKQEKIMEYIVSRTRVFFISTVVDHNNGKTTG